MPETKKELYSHHVFIFPFKWLSKSNPKETFFEQTSLSQLDNYFPSGGDWVREPYKIDKPVNYNEYNYFYDYVREALYDTYGSPLHDSESGAEHLLRHFRFNLKPGDGHYEIAIAQKDEKEKALPDKIYRLEVDSILLQFYDTGVGVLSFHLLNRDATQLHKEDILKINQFGRRLYPPFFNLPPDNVGAPTLFSHEGLDLPSKSELAKGISLQISNKETFKESWADYQKSDGFQATPFLLPKFISGLLPSAFLEAYKLDPVLDDRMFVVCWYGNDKLVKELYKPSNSLQGKAAHGVEKNYLKHTWWYKFVFVDGGNELTCQNEIMQAQLVEQATYTRWVNYGTFYGVTDYSFVLLTGSLEHLKKPDVGAAFLVTHLQTIYYKLAELVLLQRASVQRFSEEVTHISRHEPKDKYATLSKQIESLYLRYIRFVNKIYFREATAQVQGIELYQLLQQQCRIEKQVKDLNGEIHELHNYALQMLEQERVRQEEAQTEQEIKRNERLEQLTVLGVVFLPPSLLLALFGVSVIGEVNDDCEVNVLWWLAGLIIASGLFSWLAYVGIPKCLYKFKLFQNCNIKSWKTAFFILMLAIMVLGILSPICIASCDACEPDKPIEEAELPLIKEQLQSIQQQIHQFPLPLPVVVDTTKNHKK